MTAVRREKAGLSGVPETMLWTLHNRASEARRSDTYLPDPACVSIYESIDYDYVRSFGRPDDSHPMRSRIFDDAVRPWMARHPGGTVVELACGLETQFQRVDDGMVRWLCVDVADAIRLRERFLTPTERCRYSAGSALELAWMDEVDGARGVFVTAQGLFMYLEERDVRRLVTAVIERFPGVELMFDVIPRWFSKRTLKGFQKTKHYRTPRMPWGVDRDELESVLRSWSPAVASVSLTTYGARRGLPGFLLRTVGALPGLRNVPPAIAHVRTS
jgi:O-methyltransferase involved in polyketide biosynthesis